MENTDKYHLNDFTIKNYRKLLQIAKENNFSFGFYYEIGQDTTKRVLWRHDVEFSPYIALKMAQIEKEEGIKSTFFFQLHSEFYNVLTKEISGIVFKIKELGHDIGLHFDSHYFNVVNTADLEKFLNIDTQYFNSIFETSIKTFSFHNTDSFILSCDNAQYAGLINVYSKYFKNNFSYCTDSTGFWRYERLEDVLNNPDIKKLQVLTHDAMWSSEILPPRQRVFLSIDENAQHIKKFYDEGLIKLGAKNIDWKGAL